MAILFRGGHYALVQSSTSSATRLTVFPAFLGVPGFLQHTTTESIARPCLMGVSCNAQLKGTMVLTWSHSDAQGGGSCVSPVYGLLLCSRFNGCSLTGRVDV